MKKDIRKNDYILIITAVLLLILGRFLVFQFSGNGKLKGSAVQAPKIIGETSLTIDFGNGQKRAFKGEIVENENLLNVLNQAAKAGNLNYKLDEKNNIAAIGTFAATKTKTWQWHVNGKTVEKPIYEVIVRPNDEILIKYE